MSPEFILVIIFLLVFITAITCILVNHFERKNFIKNGYEEEIYIDSCGISQTKWVKKT